VAVNTSAASQISLVASLRWRIFRNSLRRGSGGVELASAAVQGLLWGGLAVLAAFGFGFVAFISVARGPLILLSVALWSVFLLWQILPFFFAASTGRQDNRLLLRFPLRYSSFLLLEMAYGLFDPVAAVGVVWLVAIGIGIVAAVPDAFFFAIPVLVIFAITCFLLNRAIFAWLDRWLARRRTRELLLFVFVLAILCAEFSRPFVSRWKNEALYARRELAPVARFLPPEVAESSIAAALRGNAGAFGLEAGMLAVYGLVFFELFDARVRAQYRGETLSEARAPEVMTARTPARAGWRLGSIPGPVAAVFEKEIRYLSRNARLMLGIAIPPIIVAYFGFSSDLRAHSPLSTRSPDLLFAIGLAAVELAQISAYNSLAYDGAGIQLFLIAPLTFRQVLAGKNLAQGAVAFVQAVLVWVTVWIMFGAPGRLNVLALVLALLFGLLSEFAVGNLMSLYFPLPLQFGTLRSRGASRTAGLGLFLTLLLVLGVPAAIFLLARSRNQIWMAALVFAALAGIAAVGYGRILGRCNRIATDRRERLCEALCR
jgi:ABC-2 type transport system permease protein